VAALAAAAVAPALGERPDQPSAADAKAEVPHDAKPAETEKSRDFSGRYLADGETDGGRKYRAMVEITREGDVYEVTWVLNPREAYKGVGLVEAQALCVGWSTGQTPGLVVYKPDKEKLVGRWTAPGSKGKVFRETLTPVK
jgi:hypothetical protein